MWDNPRLLNATAGFLVGLVAMAAVLAGAHWLLRSSLFPLRTVELSTPLEHVPRAQVEALLQRRAGGNFFAASINDLRGALEQLPWVRGASVRRVWPDRLEVSIEEHVALARWGGDALVNMRGERFVAASGAPLPLFVGPPGTEAEVTRQYERFGRLLAPVGSPIERIVLTTRRAWQLRLANGLQITLGRDGDLAEQRLQRFVQAYAGLRESLAHPEVVDLRYPNGFALRVKG
jgi:cell division protein FtsQ